MSLRYSSVSLCSLPSVEYYLFLKILQWNGGQDQWTSMPTAISCWSLSISWISYLHHCKATTGRLFLQVCHRDFTRSFCWIASADKSVIVMSVKALSELLGGCFLCLFDGVQLPGIFKPISFQADANKSVCLGQGFQPCHNLLQRSCFFPKPYAAKFGVPWASIWHFTSVGTVHSRDFLFRLVTSIS